MLLQVSDFTPVIVDAVCECDVKVFAVCLMRALRAGKEFLIRSAAALPKVLGNISDRPLLTREELVNGEENGYGGIVLIGSHVKKTTEQLESLKRTAAMAEFLEFRVDCCLEEGGALQERNRLVQEAEKVIVVKSVEAGAAVCHLHCRSADGSLTPDVTEMADTFEKIAKKTDVIIQASTGGVSQMDIVQRCYPLDYWRVESASLNGGTTNLGEKVYINTFEDIRYCAQAVYERGIIPEIEVFDIGMIYNIRMTQEEVPYRKPVFYNLVFGHKGGMQPDMECLNAFRSAFPSDARWGVTHYGRDNWEFLAAAIAMGASVVRIGFEDSRYLSPGVQADYNYQEVEKLAALIRAMDLEVATPEQAREMMHILPRKKHS